MEHWVEPKPLGNAQRCGYGSPLVSMGQGLAPQHIQPPGDPGQRLVNRPDQLRGLGLAGMFSGIRTPLLALLVGGMVGYFIGRTSKRGAA